MPKKGIRCLPSRVVVALLCATGVMELYLSRINISIAIVAMVQIVSSEDLLSNSTIQEPFCLRENQITFPDENIFSNHSFQQAEMFENITESTNSEEIAVPKIRMTALQRGNVLSAFFYAYGLSGMIGGRLAEIYGTKKVFGAAVFMDALGNFLIPFAAKSSYIFLFCIRFTMGMFQGGCYPSLHTLAAKWVPQHEHPTFVAFVFPANCFGTIFALTVCGLIISQWGWEVSFYVSGTISLIWLTFWLFLIYDSPAQHPRISEKEKEYILKAKSKSIAQKPKKVPIFKILLSRHVWAICVAHAGNMLGASFLLTQLPIYMNSIIGINIRNSGFLSALPFLARYSFANAFSWIVKYISIKNWVEKKTLRRIVTTMGFGGPAVALLLVGYVGCNTPAVIALFIFGMALNGSNLSGYSCNHLELTANFTGTSAGFASTIGFLYAMIGPVLVGALTPEETLDEWKIVYWLVFANYIIAGTTYCIFLSVERQPWDSVITDEQQLEELNPEKQLEEIENIEQREKT